jgi:spore germination protein GerM
MTARPLVLRRLVYFVAFAFLPVIVSSCGVPTETSADAVAEKNLPPSIVSPRRPVTIYYDQGGQASGISKSIPLVPDLRKSAEMVIDLLRQEVSAKERSQNYVSYLSEKVHRDYLFRVVDVKREVVSLDITGSAAIEADRTAVTQLVLSLTSIRGISKVGFTRDGKTVSKLGFSIDAGEQEPELPIGASYFAALAKEPISIRFVVNGKLRAFEHKVASFEKDVSIDVAKTYLDELVFGPQSASEGRSIVSELGPEIDLDDRSGNYILSFNARYDELSEKEKALAIGQVVLTIAEGIDQPVLPNIELYVDGQRRLVAPDASGQTRSMNYLQLSRYKGLQASAAEIASDTQGQDPTADTIAADAGFGDPVTDPATDPATDPVTETSDTSGT